MYLQDALIAAWFTVVLSVMRVLTGHAFGSDFLHTEI